MSTTWVRATGYVKRAALPRGYEMGLFVPRRTEMIASASDWEVEVRVYRDPRSHDRSRPPLVMIPGYAMNSYILAYHPDGVSLVEYLVARGWEVWTANLRGQGGSRHGGSAPRFGMAELALDDLPVVFEHVLKHTHSGVDGLVPIGCSLGATFMYGYLAHHLEDHPFVAMVSLGGPLRWDEVHPAVRVLMRSSRVAGSVRFRGTRQLAKLALPALKRVPMLLSPYMNAARIDLTHAENLVHTVEDPVPHINRQVSRWIRRRDLFMRGVNVVETLRQADPLDTLVIFANADGVVPPGAARSVADVFGEERVTLVEVGNDDHWYAHADMFIGDAAEADVFEPLERWLGDAVAPAQRKSA